MFADLLFFYLHNIRSIKKYLHKDSLHTLVNAFITNRLDYCNSLLYGASQDQIAKVQRVQNAAARLLMNVDKHSHITPKQQRLQARSTITVPTIREQCPIVKNHLRVCCFNARSIKNKTADFVCYAASTGADIYAMSETWLTDRDNAKRAEMTLPGFNLFDQPRVGRTGGGLALLLKNGIDARKMDGGEHRSFEFGEWVVRYGSKSLRIFTIYHIPYSQAHPVTTSVFFDEFTTYLESIIMSPEPLLITGDFNIHVNTPSDSDASRFHDLLSSMGLEQHVDKPTHISGHTLDLIITRCSDSLLTATPMADYLFSDHITVLCDLTLGKPSSKIEQVSYRKLKAIDIEDLKQELAISELCHNSPDSLNDLVKCYNNTLTQALERHAPLRSKVIRSRPLVPWFNEDIKNARREKRKAERKWRRSGNHEDMLSYKRIKNKTNRLMNDARCAYYQDFINDNSTNQKKLFAAANTLLNQGKKNTVLPPCDDKLELADKMGSYFVQKVTDIRTKLDVMAQDLSIDQDTPLNCTSSPTTNFNKFTALSELEVQKLIECSAKKSCSLDPLPTPLVLNCIDVLLPVITKMINLSLVEGVFADVWKCALVKPLLKKAGLDPLLSNYRPVSNLPYISKFTEKSCI